MARCQQSVYWLWASKINYGSSSNGCYVDITKNEFITSACVGKPAEYIIKWKKTRYTE